MQIQPDKKTVEGEILNALNKINIKTKISHSGRTDRGVHALNQVIAFEVPDFWNLEKLKNLLNKILYPSIYFKKITTTPADFHPRFSAKKRSYRYIISKYFTPFSAKYTLYYAKKIDLKNLNEALKILKGKHDFEFFSKTGSDVNHYIREIYKASAFEYKNFYIIKIEGNGFLRGQIRIIIDFLLKINENKLTLNDLKEQLNKKRLISKHLAPPHGLYLERIWY
jgi:tRNA pseudouridine38-40 synthase